MQVGLDGPQRSSGLARDLVEGQFTEESQGDHLAIGLRQGGQRHANIRGALRAEGQLDGIVSRCGVDRRLVDGHLDPSAQALAVPIRWITPRDGAPTPNLAQSDPGRDACHPRNERSVSAPAGKGAIGGHKALLCGILRVVHITKDAVADPDHLPGVSIDQVPEGLAVAGQHGIDRRSIDREVRRVIR